MIAKPGQVSYRIGMEVRVVIICVKPEYYDQFEEITAKNHEASLEEPGVLRFDVLKDEQNPGVYALYEMYRDSGAILAHKESRHYKEWRDQAEPMMAHPRHGMDFTILYPKSES